MFLGLICPLFTEEIKAALHPSENWVYGVLIVLLEGILVWLIQCTGNSKFLTSPKMRRTFTGVMFLTFLLLTAMWTVLSPQFRLYRHELVIVDCVNPLSESSKKRAVLLQQMLIVAHCLSIYPFALIALLFMRCRAEK